MSSELRSPALRGTQGSQSCLEPHSCEHRNSAVSKTSASGSARPAQLLARNNAASKARVFDPVVLVTERQYLKSKQFARSYQ